MKFMDMNSDSVITLQEAKVLWEDCKEEDPEMHAETFREELPEILIATLYRENDIRIIGFTMDEIFRIIARLQKGRREQ